MTKYIERDALVEWLKHVPLKDLSDGLGLCRVIMEDDFKKAIKNMPKGIIVDAVDAVPVVRCKDCIHSYDDLCGLCCTCGPYVDTVVRPEFYCADGKESRRKRKRRINNGVCNTL